MNLARRLSSAFLPLALAACATQTTQQAATSVALVNRTPSHCTALGPVSASQGGGITDYFNTDADRLNALRLDLQKQAAALGGNTVFVAVPDNTGVFASGGPAPSSASGVAYACGGR